MNQQWIGAQAHPPSREEVMTVDDVDVNVRTLSIRYASNDRERMSEHD
jgi:hypothetical protein